MWGRKGARRQKVFYRDMLPHLKQKYSSKKFPNLWLVGCSCLLRLCVLDPVVVLTLSLLRPCVFVEAPSWARPCARALATPLLPIISDLETFISKPHSFRCPGSRLRTNNDETGRSTPFHIRAVLWLVDSVRRQHSPSSPPAPSNLDWKPNMINNFFWCFIENVRVLYNIWI